VRVRAHLLAQLTFAATPDAVTHISFSLPASDIGQDITISLTPKKLTRTWSPEVDNADTEPPPFDISWTPSPSPHSFNLYADGDKHAPPGTLYRDITDMPPKPMNDYAVLQALLKCFPPALPDANRTGWNTKRWYVVMQGCRPGIYFDFW